MYESLLRNQDCLDALHGPIGPRPQPWITAVIRIGCLRIHMRHAAAVASGDDVRPILPLLMPRLQDTRTLKLAIESLKQRGPKTPGPGGLRLETMTGGEQWDFARTLGNMLKTGTYRPGPVQVKQIPKEHKPGEFRKLTIQSHHRPCRRQGHGDESSAPLSTRYYRRSTSARAPRVTGKLLWRLFLSLARAERRWYVVSADIEKAFDKRSFRQGHRRLPRS